MRWSPLLSVVIGLSIATGRLLSQETPVCDGSEPPPPPHQSILYDSNAAHFRLVLGRIELDPERYRKGIISRHSTPNDPVAAINETLAIDATGGIPRIHFTRQTARQRLTLDINEKGRLSIESDFGDERFLLIQEPKRAILTQRSRGRQVEAQEHDTWIHFYMATPDVYKKHMQPLVDDLIRGTRLCELAEKAHARSLTSLPSATLTNDGAMLRYVEMLGSTQRAERLEAQRELHQCGISVLARLRQIDRKSLDTEQRLRLEQLIKQLTPRGDDCESRVAAMIRDDWRYWLAADQRLSPGDRLLISTRMSDLGGTYASQVAKSNAKNNAVRLAANADDERRR